MQLNKFCETTDELKRLAEKCITNSIIDPTLYSKHDVKRGLRDVDGRGVLTGLTEVSDVIGFTHKDGQINPVEGKLYYRGIDVEDIVHGFIADDRFGFEEITYLLLFGEMPNKQQLMEFTSLLSYYRTLPNSFVRDIIMKAPSPNLMNALARSVLTLYSYDDRADDTSIENVLRQCLQLIALFPVLSVYSFHVYNHYHEGQSLIIHSPVSHYSTAENILHMLRPNSSFTHLEAKILDMALVLHAEHGGGNNSTFTTHVVSSSGTDTYSAIAAALGSLKGPKHGGANIKVVQMFEDIKSHINDYKDEDAIAAYLTKIIHKEAFDKSGLIYGIGHAVYSISDPRARVFKGFVKKLCEEKGKEDEFLLYDTVERLSKVLIAKERKIYKGVSANVDFYSGLVYSMLDLPSELYTPIFAVARIAGWSAHRLEELINPSKIIRPAYMNVQEHLPYVKLDDRD